MKHHTRIGIIAFCALATALTTALPARAETIFLKCGYLDTLSIDLTNHTVNNMPASITPIAIEWDTRNQYGEVHNHIDRIAGTHRTTGTYFTSNGNIPIPQSIDSCTTESQPATKF